LFVFCKGGPEKIKELSLDSSIPSNYDEITTNQSIKGLRVIALAYK
jgi:cation-transporting ATPase 13A3/4/5